MCLTHPALLLRPHAHHPGSASLRPQHFRPLVFFPATETTFLTRSFGWNAQSRLTALRNRQGSAATTVLSDFAYEYTPSSQQSTQPQAPCQRVQVCGLNELLAARPCWFAGAGHLYPSGRSRTCASLHPVFSPATQAAAGLSILKLCFRIRQRLTKRVGARLVR